MSEQKWDKRCRTCTGFLPQRGELTPDGYKTTGPCIGGAKKEVEAGDTCDLWKPQEYHRADVFEAQFATLRAEKEKAEKALNAIFSTIEIIKQQYATALSEQEE